MLKLNQGLTHLPIENVREHEVIQNIKKFLEGTINQKNFWTVCNWKLKKSHTETVLKSKGGSHSMLS
ncbi:hypothetical protein MHYMCMPSP_00239 [Hyalomma marginatum]|uniref:Uncharacterized protein n=1 Tax=Hyalomma marginatum TaxID=34627 RepID=A0A8S4C3I1_9ACAR|nr:hypothetical protein MHYMCMPSP_00239 [Hyalomma marginatum]CAG7599867.1 hypothetical protein MHYMCMPASI_01135 [Hyalomma marginatum]